MPDATEAGAWSIAAQCLRFLRTPLLIGGALVAVTLLVRLLPTGGSGLGAWAQQAGPLAFVLAGASLCAIGVPRQIVCFAAGYADGVVAGAALALLAETLGCLLDVLWVRAVARNWVRRRFGARLVRLDRLLQNRAFAATVSLRLLPVGNNLILNLAAGVSTVPVLPFLLGSAVGYVPQTVVFTMLGSGMRVEAGVQLGLAAGLFALSTGLGILVLRAGRRELAHGATRP